MKQPRVVVVRRDELEKAVKAIFAHVPQRSRLDEAIDIFERLRASPPKQERSLQTLNRLLDAAEKALEDDGLDAATVPAIARRAGVSVGVVYRRFPNKDALIRAVYERYLWRASEQNSMMLTALARVRVSLEDLLRGVVRGVLESYRRKRKLLLALSQYARRNPDLKRRAGEINRAATAALTALLLSHRDRIKHPDPEEAIRFSVLMLASVVRAIILEEEAWGLNAPEDPESELTRMIFAYLRIE